MTKIPDKAEMASTALFIWPLSRILAVRRDIKKPRIIPGNKITAYCNSRYPNRPITIKEAIEMMVPTAKTTERVLLIPGPPCF